MNWEELRKITPLGIFLSGVVILSIYSITLIGSEFWTPYVITKTVINGDILSFLIGVSPVIFSLCLIYLGYKKKREYGSWVADLTWQKPLKKR